MSDRARELAETVIGKWKNLGIRALSIEFMRDDIAKALCTAEQRGYDAGLKRAAEEATHGNGQHSVEIASRILALIGSSPATDTEREKLIAQVRLEEAKSLRELSGRAWDEEMDRFLLNRIGLYERELERIKRTEAK